MWIIIVVVLFRVKAFRILVFFCGSISIGKIFLPKIFVMGIHNDIITINTNYHNQSF